MNHFDHIDEAPKQRVKVSEAVAGPAYAFLQNLVDAKAAGRPMPKVLEKLATLTEAGQTAGARFAIEAAKEQANKKLGWILAGVAGVALVVVIFNR